MSLNDFHTSLNDFQSYPENLLNPGIGICRSVLGSLKKRLDVAAPDLCLVGVDEILNDFEVPIRDINTASGKGKVSLDKSERFLLKNLSDLEKRNIHSEEELTQWLGISTGNNNQGVVRTNKRDPKCRFM
jgi:hypothetical protein